MKLFIIGLFLMAIFPQNDSLPKKRVSLGSTGNDINPFPSCGHRLVGNGETQKRIVGGKESIPGSWPWQVALFFNGIQSCAGSLINKDWIVTAGHCFHESYSSKNPKDWRATLGEHKLADKETFEQVRGISSITIHPKYSFPYLQGIYDAPPDYDIAIIKLSSPAKMTDYVYPACLLHPGQKFNPGKKCTIIGWGHTRFSGNQPPALNEAEVKIVARETCNKNISYGGKIHERSICAGYAKGGVDACQFDSGGSLNCQDHVGQYYLTGIISWGHECAKPHKYGVYTNMAVLTSWVLDTIAALEK